MAEHYAYLETAVLCPACGTEFENTEGHIRIQIGSPHHWYRVGDLIKWSRETEIERAQVVGLSPIYAFDSDDDYSLWQCRACATAFDSPAGVIEAGRITGVCLMTRAQVRELFGLERGYVGIVGRNVADNRWTLVE